MALMILNMHLGDYSMLETTVDQLLKENGIEVVTKQVARFGHWIVALQ